MFLKFHDLLPKELKTKYFNFIPRDISDQDFCEDILNQITISYNKCKYYKENLCKKFEYTIPDEISIDELATIPYIPTDTFKKSGNRTLDLSKVPLENIALYSCSSSTTGDPSIVPRTLEDFDQIQYNSIKVFTEFFKWDELKTGSKRGVVFNFSPDRLFMSIMAKRSAKGFEFIDKTRYFTACMNKPWEFYGHEEYLVKMKWLKTIWAIISTFSMRGGFVLDVSKMLKIIRTILKTGYWKDIEVSKVLFGGSPLLMNNMFEKRLLKENVYLDLDGKAVVGCGGGGWDGVKGEAKMGAVSKTKFIESFEKVFNIKSKDIRDIYAFTEGPTLFGGHWSEKYQNFLLHCPNTARIIVRDLGNLEPIKDGEEGLLEVLTPYGVNGSINQAVLVDDIVALVSRNKCPECGYEGATFRILGRLKNARGKSCSSLIDWVY